MTPAPGEVGPLNQFWRCPKCSMGIAVGEPCKLSPPTCSTHGEMEQVTAEAFAADQERWRRGGSDVGS